MIDRSSMGKVYELVCQRCRRTFTHHRLVDIRLGRMKFCSKECATRKYEIDEGFFGSLDSQEKYRVLGQIVAVGQVNEKRYLKLVSDIRTLEDISESLRCN